MTKPKAKHKRPSAAELDERLIVPIDPEVFVEGVLQTGSHREDELNTKETRDPPSDAED